MLLRNPPLTFLVFVPHEAAHAPRSPRTLLALRGERGAGSRHRPWRLMLLVLRGHTHTRSISQILRQARATGLGFWSTKSTRKPWTRKSRQRHTVRQHRDASLRSLRLSPTPRPRSTQHAQKGYTWHGPNYTTDSRLKRASSWLTFSVWYAPSTRASAR